MHQILLHAISDILILSFVVICIHYLSEYLLQKKPTRRKQPDQDRMSIDPWHNTMAERRENVRMTRSSTTNNNNNNRRRSTSLPRRLQADSDRTIRVTRSVRPRLLRTHSVDSLTPTTRRIMSPSGTCRHSYSALEQARAHRSRMLVMDLLYSASLTAHPQQQDNNNAADAMPRFGWRGRRAFLHRHAHPRFHAHRAARDHHFAQEFMRLNYLVAREQALLAPPRPEQQPEPPNANCELQRALRPIATNDPSVTSYVYDASQESKMQLINAALRRNITLRQVHLHPSAWNDLKTIKELANILRDHPNLKCVHLHPASSDRNFVTQLAVDSLMKAFRANRSITHWCLHLSNSSSTSSSETLVECIRTADHLETLELYDLRDFKQLSTAIAKAQPSLQILKFYRAEAEALEYVFERCATEGTSNLKTLHIESASEAGTKGLDKFTKLETCKLESLTLKSIQTFQRHHADRLVGGLTQNTSVKHVAFLDCCFHPEVVRPLQDLVKNRLDLESFEISRSNADPSMALLTVCANRYEGQMTRLKRVTMGFSLGIEDRLGGDAIRSVLRYNPHLQELNLVGSHRLGPTGLRHVARGLGKNSTLRKLDLSHCSIGLPSLRLLTQHITGNPNSQLMSLNLSHNALGVQGIQVLTRDWLLQPDCFVQELILNRCEIYSEAFLALMRALQQNTSLEVLQVLECGRLGVNELQELGEMLFRLGSLRVLKASCFKSPVQPIRPVPPHVVGGGGGAAVAPAVGPEDFVFLPNDNDEEDFESDDEEEEIAPLIEEDVAEMAAAVAHNIPNQNNSISNSGSMKLLKETFLAGLIHNQRLEHISLTNILECVLKPKDAVRVRAWMEFCGKRNKMQPLLQQTEIPLLDILTDVVRECRDPRTNILNATGLSLHYYCLRNRPDALDRVQRMLIAEAERQAVGLGDQKP